MDKTMRAKLLTLVMLGLGHVYDYVSDLWD